MDGILITSGELSETAKRVRQLNQNMGAQLEQISAEMNQLADTWQSDAGSQIRERFASLRPAFEQYREVVDAYATFLDNTAANYEEAEQAIYTQAAQF